jgi:hypothetical protein
MAVMLGLGLVWTVLGAACHYMGAGFTGVSVGTPGLCLFKQTCQSVKTSLVF